eukprot:m.40080 g.40080  ORF g.40080 m.40080 type:complete len:241 (-) comp9623_c0_seq1:1181-1903(-)
MGSEKNDLLPHRLDSSSLEMVERGLGGIAILIACVAALLGFIHGFKYHMEHTVMAGTCIANAILFALLGRLYMKDFLQDRKVVYFSGFCLFLTSITGILYATTWNAPAACFGDCITTSSDYQSFYNPNIPNSDNSKGACMRFSANANPFSGLPEETKVGSPCQIVAIGAGGSVNMRNLTNTLIPDQLTCSTAQGFMQQCWKGNPSFAKWPKKGGCPAPAPSPAPGPAPGPSPPGPAPSPR